MILKAKLLIAVLSLFIIAGINAQTPPNQELTTSKLSYHPEIPLPGSYTVLKNASGQSVPDSLLLKVNLHRKADENFVWKVNENFELLIFPINASKEKSK